MRFRSLLLLTMAILLAIGFYGCASEEETEIQPEEVIEVESEEETETKPVEIEIEKKFDKHALMYKLWPEWDQYTYASKTDPGNPSGFLSMLDDFQRLFYPFEFSYGYGGGPATEKGVRKQNMAVLYENLDCTMYATKNQFVYSNLFPGNLLRHRNPIWGK